MAKVARLAYMQAHYINTGGSSASEYNLMSVFTSINESPNAQTEETQYTVNKSKSTETTGYQTQWAFEGVLHAEEKTVEFLEKIGKEQLLGADAQTDLVIVELDKPAGLEKANTFYARKCHVGVEITDLPTEAGEKRKISGNLNALEDIIVGEFNTETKQFTEAGV